MCVCCCQPLEVLDVVSIPKGNEGVHFMSTLSVSNDGTGGLNFLEGCYHMYDPAVSACVFCCSWASNNTSEAIGLVAVY